MKRVISKFGAYTSHLIALAEDSSIKAVDRAKLSGYCSKWMNAKYILGCAFYCDLLSPCAIFSKVMQYDSLDVLGGFSSLLCTVKEVVLSHCSTGLLIPVHLKVLQKKMVIKCTSVKS